MSVLLDDLIETSLATGDMAELSPSQLLSHYLISAIIAYDPDNAPERLFSSLSLSAGMPWPSELEFLTITDRHDRHVLRDALAEHMGDDLEKESPLLSWMQGPDQGLVYVRKALARLSVDCDNYNLPVETMTDMQDLGGWIFMETVLKMGTSRASAWVRPSMQLVEQDDEYWDSAPKLPGIFYIDGSVKQFSSHENLFDDANHITLANTMVFVKKGCLKEADTQPGGKLHDVGLVVEVNDLDQLNYFMDMPYYVQDDLGTPVTHTVRNWLLTQMVEIKEGRIQLPDILPEILAVLESIETETAKLPPIRITRDLLARNPELVDYVVTEFNLSRERIGGWMSSNDPNDYAIPSGVDMCVRHALHDVNVPPYLQSFYWDNVEIDSQILDIMVSEQRALIHCVPGEPLAMEAWGER